MAPGCGARRGAAISFEADLRELVRTIVREEIATTGEAEPDRLLAIPEAAAALGIGRTLAYNLIGRGRLRVIRAGRRVLVPSSSVRDYIAGR